MKILFRFFVRAITAIDWPLMVVLLLLAGAGLIVMHSAVGGTDWRFADQVRNFAVALAAMWVVAMTPPHVIIRLAIPFYVLGIVLLLGVMFFGDTSKGATRWLNLGFTRIQPSEMMKIAAPLMLVWYFQSREGSVRILDFFVAGTLLAVPFLLIVKQPDLGTALLVFGAGFCVMYFAGLSFKLLVPLLVVGVIGIGGIVAYQKELCQPETIWIGLHDYQKQRVCTLLDPTTDPLGKGFHIIQSTIAVGSGGVYGKGYMAGTQSQLDFIPERTTDFIFAVFAEEFGLYGGVTLLVLYLVLIGLRPLKTEKLPAFLHIFTHYRLTIAPVITQVAEPKRSAVVKHSIKPALQWIKIGSLDSKGLPAPIRKLLLGLTTDKVLK